MMYRAMYKSRLAKYAGVSLRTLSRWMVRDKDYLESQGVTDRTRLLPAQVVQYLCEKYCIDLE